MGITINDTLTLQNGLVVSGVYASLSGMPVNIVRTTTYMTENDSDWLATTTYNIWASKDAASKNLPYIQQDFVRTPYDPKDNPFDVLYTAIKAKYSSTTDC